MKASICYHDTGHNYELKKYTITCHDAKLRECITQYIKKSKFGSDTLLQKEFSSYLDTLSPYIEVVLKPGIYAEDVKVLVWEADNIDEPKVEGQYQKFEAYLHSIQNSSGHNYYTAWCNGETGQEKNYDIRELATYNRCELCPVERFKITKSEHFTLFEWLV